MSHYSHYMHFTHRMGWTELSSTVIQENFHLFFDRMNLESQNMDQKTNLTLHPEMGEGYVRRFLPRYEYGSCCDMRDQYEKLSQIAPTVILPQAGDWRETLQRMAAIIGKEEKATNVLAEFYRKSAVYKEQLAFRSQESVMFVINNWQAPIQGGVKEALNGSNVWNSLNAVKNNRIYELADPSLPGPMALVKIDGIEEIMKAMGKQK